MNDNNRTLKELTEQVAQFRDERDWKQFHRPKDMAISLMLEAAEVAELFQWKPDAAFDALPDETREQIGDELADVLYWVLLMGRDFGINLENAFERKMKKNAEKYPAEKVRGRSGKYTEYAG